MIQNTSQIQIERIPKRILSSLLSSVSAGVVPRAGAPYIAIGRYCGGVGGLTHGDIFARNG